MPGAQCTRSLVRAGVVLVCARVFTAEAPESSGIPHAMVLRLIRDLPGDEFLLPPSLTNSRRVRARLGRHASVNLTPTTGARTTRLHRPQHCRSSRAPLPTAHESLRPALSCAHDIVASTASRPTFRDDLAVTPLFIEAGCERTCR